MTSCDDDGKTIYLAFSDEIQGNTSYRNIGYVSSIYITVKYGGLFHKSNWLSIKQHLVTFSSIRVYVLDVATSVDLGELMEDGAQQLCDSAPTFPFVLTVK